MVEASELDRAELPPRQSMATIFNKIVVYFIGQEIYQRKKSTHRNENNTSGSSNTSEEQHL